MVIDVSSDLKSIILKQFCLCVHYLGQCGYYLIKFLDREIIHTQC